jgi:putative membrane protein
MNKDLILREKLALERTDMANDTTLLAFIRTSLYFLVAGLTINSLIPVKHGIIIKWSLWFFAAFVLITGVVKYIRNKRKLRESEKHIGDYKLEYEAEEY